MMSCRDMCHDTSGLEVLHQPRESAFEDEYWSHSRSPSHKAIDLSCSAQFEEYNPKVGQHERASFGVKE